MTCAAAGEAHHAAGWEARLALRFARRDEKAQLVHREHHGPLVVQKMLYPEGPGVCQAIVVHPPGGIAGGDRLMLEVDVDEHTHAQLTTPGAAKWYRSGGAPAIQTIAMRACAGATLEWLPQETIVFDGARAELAMSVQLGGDATFIAWDIVSLGRVESGERFARGSFGHRFELVRDGALVWAERSRLSAGDRLLASPAGLNGAPMFGTFVAATPVVPMELLAACREIAIDTGAALQGAVTRFPGVLVARCRGASTESARRWFAALWAVVRPALTGRHAVPPRIWLT